MGNENITQGIDIQENQHQSNTSNIENFLQNIPNKELIQDTLNTHNLANNFESYLTNIPKTKEIQLKNKLKKCTTMEETHSTIIEYLFEQAGYQIGYQDIKNTFMIAQEVKQQTQEVNQQTQEINQQAQEINQETQEVKQQTQEVSQQTQEVNQQTQEVNQQTQEVNQQTQEINQQAQEINQQAQKVNQQTQEVNQQTQEINQQAQEINQETQEVNQQTQEVNQQTQEVNQQTQEVNQQTQEVNQQTQGTDINKIKTFEKVSGLKEIEEAISARQELINDHPELAEQTDKDSELYQATKSEFEQSGIIQQLKDSNHDEDFINNYILVHTTLKEVKTNENYKDVNISFFEKAVKNLDNACNIPDTKFNDFSREKITKTRTELFDADIGNHSLKEAKKSNKESAIHQKTYNEIFALDENKDRDTELIEKYGKFIEDDNIKDLVKKYENNELSEQDSDTLRKGLESIKENIDNQTKDLIEEMCLIAPIQGIFACIGPELGNNFNLNKSREISNENGEITITGHIDGIPFSLHHDTTDPNARLQTSSALTKIDNNKFEIGEKFIDSPFKLPTNGDIFAIATSCITDEDVTSAENPTKYFQTLQEKISEKIEKELYKNAKYANHYIKDKIKGEKITNQYLNVLGEIKGSSIKGNIDQSNFKLYNFVDLIDSNSYISTISEKEDISHCIDSIKDAISQYGKLNKQSNRYPTIIRHFLMDKTILENTQKILNGYDIPGESIFDLFGYYIEQNSGIKTINFKQLKKDLEGKEGQESLVASNRQDNKNKENADIELDNAIENIV